MPVYSVNVYPSSATIKKGKWYYDAYAVVNASDDCCKDVEWCSGNTSVATVNEKSGYIYGCSPGTAKIYAVSKVDESKKDYITVTVTNDTICVDSVSLNKTVLTLEKGESETLCETVCPTNATNKNVSWSSSKPYVASVDDNGTVTAKSVGATWVKATAVDGSEEYGACSVRVTGDILVSSVTISPSSKTMTVGGSAYLHETVCPSNATKKCVEWTSDKPHIAFVNPDSGFVTAQGAGTATITATAQDGSNKKGYCTITVNAPVAVTDVEVCPTSLNMNVGDVECLCATITPSNATAKMVIWSSSNEDVATVGLLTGKVTAKKAGTTTITATTVDGGFQACCDVWVKGKTPVFLIHGRTSNSTDVWGVNNNIPSGKNDDFKSDINAVALNGRKYIDVTSQEINDYEPNEGGNETPVNLGIHLQNSGYNKNLNLFVFNYPNEDAVKYSAQKFLAYIANLISYVRSSGSNEMKACFYASRSDYDNNNFKINIVGHSMGGLVARYYIENMNQDIYVDKLITICTPHWGSGYADASNIIGIPHVLCDHDLARNSAMYGGELSLSLNCQAGLDLLPCYIGNYSLTNELLYNKQRSTKYYAIAGIDYNADTKDLNDYAFEMPSKYTTYQQITNFLNNKNLYKSQDCIDVKEVGDNLVGFLSQIGWTEVGNTSPNKRIQMEKIYIDVDTDGGNSLLDRLHSKAPHRTCIVQKVCSYLDE